MKYKNLIGKKYGKLLILEEDKNINKRGTYYKCQCDCGNIKSILGFNVINGRTKSCGCITKEINKYNAPNTKHKLSKTRIYRIWSKMKNRCYNNKYYQYYLYGGKGIKVCDEWLNKDKGFINFYNWSMNNGYLDNLTIDRINGNDDYKPTNCRWVTQKEQCQNIKTNINITYNNETHCIAEWSRITEINNSTLYWRCKNKKDVKEILKEYIKTNDF